ncbi:MAG TPA: ABC transporter permease [Stellaceae bacterium]|nr:ABC transporter permease [Stellaceae bacterium]
MIKRIHPIFWTIGSFALVFVVWDLIVRLFAMPEYLLPGPEPVFVSLVKNIATLWYEMWWTAATILIGFVAAAAFAIPLAMMIVISPMLERLLYPPMVATQSIPKIALAPLFIVWFGFGVLPKVAVAFLIAFFPIVIDTIFGLRSIDPAMIQLARSMGAPPRRIFLKLRLPHALPAIFGGLKVASSLAVVGALTGEFVGSDKGLGYLLVQASGNLNTSLLFATLVVLSALAMAFFYLVEVVERISIPWHASQRAHPQ